MNKSKEILVIGAGLAGTFCALELCRAGHKVLMYHNAQPGDATAAGAGLFNVITGRHAVKTWMADKFLAKIRSLYDDPELSFLKNHIHYIPIYRPFRSAGEVNELTARYGGKEHEELVEIRRTPQLGDRLNDPFGGLIIKLCGWADFRPMTEDIRRHLHKHYTFREENHEFIHKDFDPHSCTYREMRFDRILFCEGHRLRFNPFFKGIDLRPLKGQLAEIEIPRFSPSFILSRKLYFIPVAQNRFVAGGTYEKEFSHPEPDEKGANLIDNQIKEVINTDFKILNLRAGIRPTTPNRRPIVGIHPHFKTMLLLNGLGTKGMLQAPYFAEKIVELIENPDSGVQKSVTPERFDFTFS